jgi:hypothetical protein
MEKFGFIILRHVNSALTNHYWKECCRCIRQFHKEKIVIIDDNSNYDYIDAHEFADVEVIQSEFPKRGEVLPYYYMHRMALFEKAIILHDGMFLTRSIDEYADSIVDFQFLWHFADHTSDVPKERAIMSMMRDTEGLLKLYDNNRMWVGCFGVASIVTLDFLNRIEKRHEFLDICIREISDRRHRSMFERIFACLCIVNMVNKRSFISAFGDIYAYCRWGITYGMYVNYDTKTRLSYPIVKVWTGR